MPLEFASELTTRLQSTQNNNSSLILEIQSHVNTLHTSGSLVLAYRTEEFDRLATQLWNLATRLRREHDSGADYDKLLLLVRIFAFYVLDCSRSTARASLQAQIRIFKVANKAAKSCLDTQELDLALKVLQRAATYEEALSEPSQHAGENDAVARSKLRVDYYGLRIALVRFSIQSSSSKVDRLF